MIKKWISMLLIICLLVQMVPAAAFASTGRELTQAEFTLVSESQLEDLDERGVVAVVLVVPYDSEALLSDEEFEIKIAYNDRSGYLVLYAKAGEKGLYRDKKCTEPYRAIDAEGKESANHLIDYEATEVESLIVWEDDYGNSFTSEEVMGYAHEHHTVYRARFIGYKLDKYEGEGAGRELKWSVTINENQQILAYTNELGETTKAEYTERGSMKSETTARGNTTYYEYEEYTEKVEIDGKLKDITQERLRKVTYPDGGEESYEYDREGRLEVHQSPSGMIKTFGYDERDRIVEKCIYDERWNLISTERRAYSIETSGSGIVETEEVTIGERVTKKEISYSVTNEGDIRAIEDGSIDEEKEEEYKKNNTTVVTDAEGNETEYRYRNGKVQSAIYYYEGDQRLIVYDYDAEGNVTKEQIEILEEGSEVLKTETLQENIYEYGTKEGGGKYIRKVTQIDGNGNRRVSSYDEKENLTSYEDANGNVTTYEYDGVYLKKSVSPLGYVTEYIYDGANRITEVKSGVRTVTLMEYDADGNVTKQRVLEKGKEVASGIMEYDCMGRKTADKDGEGNLIASYTYDEGGRVTRVTDGTGNATVYTYDVFGNVLTEKDAYKNTKSYSYNMYGEVESVTDEAGRRAIVRYDKKGNIIEETDRGGNVTTFTYDRENRPKTINRQVNGKILTTSYEYDEQGNTTLVTTPEEGSVRFAYDKEGNVLSMTDAMGNTQYMAYDKEGNLTESTDREGNVTTYTYDKQNRKTSETNSIGTKTEYVYDAFDNVLEEKVTADGKTVTKKNVYDGAGRLTEAGNELAQDGSSLNRRRYAYDNRGNVVKETFEDGESQKTYAYDRVGNLTEESYYVSGEKIYTYTNEYDRLNRLVLTRDEQGREKRYEYTVTGLLEKEIDIRGQETVYTYDAMDNLIRVTEPMGAELTFTYDSLGNKTSQTDAKGNTTFFEYDKEGNILREIYADNTSTSYAYDKNNRVIKVTDALGNDILYEYDKNDNQTAVTDGRGNKTRYEYDSLSRLVKEIDADGGEYIYAYDGLSRVIKERDADGGYITYGYDNKGRVTVERDCYGNGRLYSYDALDRVASETDEKGNGITYEYDAFGNVTKVTDTQGGISSYAYDTDGNLTNYTDPLGNKYEYGYDEFGRRTSETDPLGNSTYCEYDYYGNVIRAVDGNGNVTSYTYDANGNMTEETNAIGYASKVIYDNMNRPLEIQNQWVDENRGIDRWQSTAYRYDALGRVIKEVSGDHVKDADQENVKAKRFEYDEAGNQVAKTEEDGSRTTYDYTCLNLLREVTYEDGEKVTFTYDKTGAMTEMKDSLGVTTVEVDLLDRARKVRDHEGREVEYIYDEKGNLSRLIYPDKSEVSYTYDNLGRLSFVSDGDDKEKRSTIYSYDEAGHIKAKIYENGERTNYTYDAAGYLVQIDRYKGDGKLFSYEKYTYDANGNKTRIASFVSEEGVDPASKEKKEETIKTYSYDPLNRLVAAREGGDTVRYTYDSLGNMVSEEGKEGVTRYRYNNLNQLISKEGREGKIEYEYDERGNRIKEEGTFGTREYAYNYADKLIEGENEEGEKSEYEYNGLGKKVKTKTRTKEGGRETREYVVDYLSMESNDLYMYVEGKEDYSKKYIYGNGEEISFTKTSAKGDRSKYYIHEDIMGSIVYVTGAKSEIAGKAEYEPWGNPESKDADKGTLMETVFTGHQYDAVLGLYYADARFYDPKTKSFMTMDPARDGANWYQYCGSNPVNYWDPTGLKWTWEGVLNLFSDLSGGDMYEDAAAYESMDYLSENPEIIVEFAVVTGCIGLAMWLGPIAGTALAAGERAVAMVELLVESGFEGLQSSVNYCIGQSYAGKAVDPNEAIKKFGTSALDNILCDAALTLTLGTAGLVIGYGVGKIAKSVRKTTDDVKFRYSLEDPGDNPGNNPFDMNKYGKNSFDTEEKRLFYIGAITDQGLKRHLMEKYDELSAEYKGLLGEKMQDDTCVAIRSGWTYTPSISDTTVFNGVKNRIGRKFEIKFSYAKDSYRCAKGEFWVHNQAVEYYMEKVYLKMGYAKIENEKFIVPTGSEGRNIFKEVCLTNNSEPWGGICYQESHQIEFQTSGINEHLFAKENGMAIKGKGALIYHEMGHAIHYAQEEVLYDLYKKVVERKGGTPEGSFEAFLKKSRETEGTAERISRYAQNAVGLSQHYQKTIADNHVDKTNNSEYFAEFFSLYMRGDQAGINDTLSEVLDELCAHNRRMMEREPEEIPKIEDSKLSDNGCRIF